MESPLFYGKAACDTMIRKWQASELPPKGQFHYHQGVFLSGMYQIYQLCGEEAYLEYIKEWVDSIIDENGEIHTFNPGQLDDIQPGILLYPLIDRTGNVKYQKALDRLLEVVWNFHRNTEGGLWHKEWYPNQMWLDGLYMAGPICAEYAARYGKPEYLELAVQQALLMREKTEDRKTGLWYHAWESTRETTWADPETGRSSEFWGRSIGWVPVAILNELDFISETDPSYEKLCMLVKDLLMAVCRFQSEEGRWYQVVNKGDHAGNWVENSCSCLYVAAICKAVRKNILDKTYLKQAQKGYEAVIRSLDWDGEEIQIGNVCVGTCVGNYEYYCGRPTSVNDLHGVGAFLIMCAEAQMILQ